ncbi:antibiotic biosynthesis monooxygenase family protein [Hymenobacter sp. DG25B]|jgi:quinol monooxygenase YgiN|uniref:antibiotic biosynthesis monooxygenase family protein n=1 Tax=Hymenobacter sp. DG25B TaxID=1385664 RepID=UPI000ACCBAB4|nr:antibiotic biosynthesis monooxygenase [Hymenobacter sp. DG25B]
MFVRLTSMSFTPDQIEGAKKVYAEEIVPIVRGQKGCLDIMLLEPLVETDAHISCTMWNSKIEADAYETSGVYQQMVNKLTNSLTGQPKLRSYYVQHARYPEVPKA